MSYGPEAFALTKKQEIEVEMADMKILYFSSGLTRLDEIRMEYIR